MSPQETARANLERLSAAANAMQSYLLGFVTQADINRIGEDLTRLRAVDRKSTRLNSSHVSESRMPSSA